MQPDHKSIPEYIRERMDELDLTQRDLIPIIGSRSKVSEILSGRRDVTMPVARALYKHLGVPADVLLQDPPNPLEEEFDYKKFPVREMMKNGWIGRSTNPVRDAEKLIKPLQISAGEVHSVVLPRKNDLNRVNAKLNPYALLAWQWRVLAAARQKALPDYNSGRITREFMDGVAEASCGQQGPLKAQRLLHEAGITFVIVPHLSRTYLDGVLIKAPDERPIIGITLRYDRLDNFWFTLEHELSHLIQVERGLANSHFFDDVSMKASNYVEEEADDIARNVLIPPEMWASSGMDSDTSATEVIEFASEIRRHPAIVAGRIRYENRDFRKLSQLVGNGKVRQLFKASCTSHCAL